VSYSDKHLAQSYLFKIRFTFYVRIGLYNYDCFNLRNRKNRKKW